ncbi:uncharacterized protein PF3D7_1205000-like [Argopecten irradians]|uniref:uncharacterized protein PF3D7_1205000-like n=1 Tax=Argopecten irradians TaxID=31199 RepID=UPI00371E0C28
MANIGGETSLTEDKTRSHSDIRTMVDETRNTPCNDSNVISSPGGAVGKTKRTRVGLTAKHKREICLYKQFNPKATQENLVQLCKDRWNLPAGRTTLGEVLRQKDKWLNIIPGQEERRRSRGGRHNKLEVDLFTWICAQRKLHTTLSDQMIIDKAKSIGEELNIDPSFSYSNGWLFKFKKRHGIKSKGTTGRFQMLESCLSSMEVHNPSVSFESNSMDCSGSDSIANVQGHLNIFSNDLGNSIMAAMDQSQLYPSHSENTAEQKHIISNCQPNNDTIFPASGEMIIKEEYISDNENNNDSNETNDVDENINSVHTNISHFPPLHLECENEIHQTLTRQFVTDNRTEGMSESKNRKTNSNASHHLVSTKRIISASEAKHGILMCIRYIEQHPELGEHLDALWEVHDDIESHDQRESPRQKTITDYF